MVGVLRRLMNAVPYFPVQPLHRLCGTQAQFAAPDGTIALTFDDGPHPTRTPAVLDCLKAAGARATFFVVGSRAEALPHFIRRIVDEGHQLGHHAWSHRFLPTMSDGTLGRELDRTSALLEGISGQRPALIRPPYGWGDRRFYAAAARRGLKPVLWSLDSFDYLRLPARAVHLRLQRAAPGDIVLLHDGNAGAAGTLPALEGYLAKTRVPGPAHRGLERGAIP